MGAQEGLPRNRAAHRPRRGALGARARDCEIAGRGEYGRSIRARSGKRNTSELPDLPALQGRLTKIGELSSGRGPTYLPSKAGKSRKFADYDVFLFPEQALKVSTLMEHGAEVT